VSTTTAEPDEPGFFERLRKGAGSTAVQSALTGLAYAGKLHPASRAWMKGVDVERDIPYRRGGDPAHLLDIYRPQGVEGPLPVMLYIHGGGFRILSKDTHWMFGAGYAKRGFLVFNVNYRLAPKGIFPDQVVDVAMALQWVMEHAEEYGGDLSRLVYGGESAGANLSLAMMIAGSWKRPEPYAQIVWEAAPKPLAVLPHCGMLQVSDAERYLDNEKLPVWIRDRIATVCKGYLPDSSGDADRFAFADPVVFLEKAGPPDRPLPAVFSVCGTADPVLDDTRRLREALTKFEPESEIRIYEGGIHAFHAFIWQALAIQSWADQDVFLARHVPGLLLGDSD
jgi:acetyl esterase